MERLNRWLALSAAAVVLLTAVFYFWQGRERPASVETDSEELTVALTFDDGPHPAYTSRLLDGLKERGVKATFFLIGKSAEKYPELVQRMAEEGHLIGNHTYSHVQLSKCSVTGAMEEVVKTNTLLEDLTGERMEYIRPPFGCWNNHLTDRLDMTEVLWDVDPLDWKVQNTATVVNHILMNVKNNQIILLHDVYDTSEEAAFQEIDALQARGYRFVTVDELLVD